MSQNSELDAAICELNRATERLYVLEKNTALARHNETEGRNIVNNAQKRIDELVAAVKKQHSPRDSNWARSALVMRDE